MRSVHTEEPGVAADIGCGEGTDTVALLDFGWRVTAQDAEPDGLDRLAARVDPTARDRLTIRCSSFAELADEGLDEVDLVFAAVSLPFCPPECFDSLWAQLVSAVRPGGWLAVNFFGPNDTWAIEPDMTFHDRAAVDALLDGLDVRKLVESEFDGAAVSGPKHWHLFDVIARRP